MEFYISAQGRVSRREYWLRWLLPAFLIYLALFTIVMLANAFSPYDPSTPFEPPGGFWLVVLVQLVLLCPMIAVGAKRLHDIGWSGWLIALLIVPVAFPFIMAATMFIPGARGVNHYGPNPRERTA